MVCWDGLGLWRVARSFEGAALQCITVHALHLSTAACWLASSTAARVVLSCSLTLPLAPWLHGCTHSTVHCTVHLLDHHRACPPMQRMCVLCVLSCPAVWPADALPAGRATFTPSDPAVLGASNFVRLARLSLCWLLLPGRHLIVAGACRCGALHQRPVSAPPLLQQHNAQGLLFGARQHLYPAAFCNSVSDAAAGGLRACLCMHAGWRAWHLLGCSGVGLHSDISCASQAGDEHETWPALASDGGGCQQPRCLCSATQEDALRRHHACMHRM